MKRKKISEGKEELNFLSRLVENKGYGHCYVCYVRFGRIRITNRYCKKCNEWFCEGEHGAFGKNGVGYCLMHDSVLLKYFNE